LVELRLGKADQHQPKLDGAADVLEKKYSPSPLISGVVETISDCPGPSVASKRETIENQPILAGLLDHHPFLPPHRAFISPCSISA